MGDQVKVQVFAIDEDTARELASLIDSDNVANDIVGCPSNGLSHISAVLREGWDEEPTDDPVGEFEKFISAIEADEEECECCQAEPCPCGCDLLDDEPQGTSDYVILKAKHGSEMVSVKVGSSHTFHTFAECIKHFHPDLQRQLRLQWLEYFA
jgi:hypothetical protein